MAESRPTKVSQSRLDELMAHSSISREIIVNQTSAIVKSGTEKGLLLEIRLPSYRSLPLACIEKIAVKIDGEEVSLSAAALRIDNSWHRLADLPRLVDVWWFILDTATLLVPEVVLVGQHEVVVEIVRVEPYITAGRFSFTDASTAAVLVEETADVYT